MENIKVSIIIAAYNVEEYISRCLNSIISQSLKDIQIIVVNDGSVDSTPTKIKQFCANDSRIILINQENKGAMEARKEGLIKAIGKYVLFVDGDDWLENQALEILYNNAEENNSDIVLYHAYKVYGDKKIKFLTFEDDLDNYSLLEYLHGKIEPNIWAKFIKLDYIKENSIEFPSNISFAEDLAMCCALSIFNPKVSTEEKKLYNYYMRETSITNTVNSKILDIIEAFHYIKMLFKKNNLYGTYRMQYEYLVYQHMFFVWFLKYSNIEKKYSYNLYKAYRAQNINIRANPYIKEQISNYSIALKLRVFAYHKSYILGNLYDGIRKLVRR